MDSIALDIFSNKSFDCALLLKFGFEKRRGYYFYSADILGGQFQAEIKILRGKEFCAKVFDKEFGDVYELHLVPAARGKLVESVRREYCALLSLIAKNCCKNEPFKTAQAKKTADFIRKEFSVELEFLWEKFPDCAIARRPDNRKWFAVFLTCAKNKLGLEGDEKLEVLDIRFSREDNPNLDEKKYFSAYHMNKNKWLTIIFGGGLRQPQINSLIKTSYALALKK